MPRRRFQYDYTVFKGGKWSELRTMRAFDVADALAQIERTHGVRDQDGDIELRGSDNPADGDLYVGND